MTNKAALFYEGLNEAITNKIDSVSPFRAMVHDVVDGRVRIQMIGTDAPLDAPIARVEGFDLQAGDEVLVGRTNSGSMIVLGRIVRSAGGTKLVSVDSETAFKVQKTDGTAIFEVDTISPSEVRIQNSVPLRGYKTDASQAWEIDADGDATFKSYNSPQIYQIQGWAPTVASTTNNTTYQEVRELTFTLPAGTWSLFCIAVANYKTTGTWVDFRWNVGGTAFGVQNVNAGGVWNSGPLMGAIHNRSGAQSVKLEYKAYSAGNTAEVRNHAITVIATRTS